MTGTSIGITIIVILLVPTLFQVVISSIKQEKRHKEIIERLDKLEEKLK